MDTPREMTPLPGRGWPSDLTASRGRRLRARLLGWYRENRRDLPWRRTRDPYAIWISEAMLQQTRVEAVVGYWTRFMARFPTVQALAGAEEAQVLSLWSGLGYYRRARALHGAARILVDDHDGELPRTTEELRRLPGVGPYTAAAVVSIAFDQPEALVDGNVERVFARMFLLDGARGSAGLKKSAWALARRMLPVRGAGDWNQALMELGATVCTPRSPRCGACPWARSCAARRAGEEERVPERAQARETVALKVEVLLVEEGDRILLELRPEGGAMAGLWQLPTRVAGQGSSPLFAGGWPDGSVGVGEVGKRLRHAITHHRIEATLWRGRLESDITRVDPRFAWHARASLGSIPVTGLTAKSIARVKPRRASAHAPSLLR